MPEFKITPVFKKTIPWKLVVIFLCFSATIIIVGILFYKSQRNRIYKEQENSLSAIASLKIGQIKQWQNERFGNAAVIRDDEPLINRIKQYLKDENLPGIENELAKWMESLYKEYDYSGVSLVDTLLNIRLTASSFDSITIEGIGKEINEVIRDQMILMTDLQ